MKHLSKTALLVHIVSLSTIIFFVSAFNAFAGDPCPSSGEKTRERGSGREGGGIRTGVFIDITGLLKGGTKKKKHKDDCCEFESIYIKNIWTKGQDVDVTITGSSGAQTKRIPPGKTFMFSGDLGQCFRVTVMSTDPKAPYLLVEDVNVCCKDLEKGKEPRFMEVAIIDYTTKPCVVTKPAGPTPAPSPVPPDQPKEPVPPEQPKEPVPPETGPQPPPEKPKEPLTPEKPEEPLTPEKPEEPLTPEKPEEPLTPEKPEEPLTPEKPEEPLTPEKPKEPSPPEKPKEPTTPSGPTVPRQPLPPEEPKTPTPPPTEQPPPVIPRLGIDITKCVSSWFPRNDNFVKFFAKIYKWVPGRGWVYPGPPRVITFKLSDVSREKGICLNKGDQTTPDLYFKSGQPDFVLSGGEGTFYDTATTTRPVTEAAVTVSSDDFGSFGKIKSSAPGCEDIAPNGPVSIPLDDNGNTIADCLLQDDNGAPPNKDKDNTPRLDGYDGDGYSNYEEYRGFFVQGTHRRMDITIKGLLINDQTGRGVGHYIKTGISVHLVADAELRDRVANFNRGHATTGAQHGLILKMNAGEIPANIGGRSVQTRINEGIMGPPKNVTATVLNYWSASNVAHELGHSTCVWHHGEAPWGFTRFWSDKPAYNHPSLFGIRNLFRDVFRQQELSLCGQPLPADFRFHPKGAQQSGDVDCVMKYCRFFEVYIDDDIYQCWPSTDPDGTGWCTSNAGTGYNSGGRVGGDATKGNCLGQLRVNDK